MNPGNIAVSDSNYVAIVDIYLLKYAIVASNSRMQIYFIYIKVLTSKKLEVLHLGEPNYNVIPLGTEEKNK